MTKPEEAVNNWGETLEESAKRSPSPNYHPGLREWYQREKLMKLWLLKPKDHRPWPSYDDEDNPLLVPCGVSRLIVREESETAARIRAATHAGPEGHEGWLDENYSSCDEIISPFPTAMVMAEFSKDGENGLLLRDADEDRCAEHHWNNMWANFPQNTPP